MFCSPCGTGSSSNYSNLSTINPITNLQNVGFDVFSRLISETPTTLFTSHTAFTQQNEILDYYSSGTGVITADISNTLMLLSANDGGGRAIRQSHEYQLYQPGKAHLSILTWTPQFSGTFDNSVAVRCGIYDDYRDKNTPAGTTGPPPYAFVSSIYGGTGQETNQYSMGHFFELSGNQWFVVERANSVDNSTNVLRVAQANWNTNPLLGGTTPTNPNGYTLPSTMTTGAIFFVERQWLGVGIVRMGIYFQGEPIICHVFTGRNLNRTYTHLPKLPLRYEIEKVSGGVNATATTGTICESSLIGGNYLPYGQIYSLPANLTIATTRVSQDLRPILLLRLQQQYCRATFKLKEVSLYGAAAGAYSIFRNPVITGPITWVNNPDSRSMIQYAVFANGTTIPSNTISGGLCVRSGFFDVRTTETDINSVEDLLTATSFTSNIEGVPDVLCIAMAGFSANDDVNATCRWIEIV